MKPAGTTAQTKSIVSRALNKARPALKKKGSGRKNSLTEIAENEMSENPSIDCIDAEDDDDHHHRQRRLQKRKSRSSLSQPAAMQMIGVIDDSDD